MDLNIESWTQCEMVGRAIYSDPQLDFLQKVQKLKAMRPPFAPGADSHLYSKPVAWFVGEDPVLSSRTFVRLKRLAESAHARAEPSAAAQEDARAYVAKLLDVDLSECRYVSVPAHAWRQAKGDAEAMASYCGTREHLLLGPEEIVDARSQLVHEFGHAAHVTLRRETDAIEFWLPHMRTAEFVAYACQLQFIAERGDRREMAHALEALSAVYFSWLVLTKRNLSDSDFSRDEDVTRAYAALPFELVSWRRSRAREQLIEHWFRMYAFGMAIQLVAGGGVEGLREFASKDRVNADLEELAAQCFGNKHTLFQLASLEDSIRKLLQ